MLVAPSILSADFGNLNVEIERLNTTNCDFIHIDIMDGHFVPNLTFGTCVVESIKKISKKPLDIHLMVKNIPFFINLFAPLKPEFLSFHIEEEQHVDRIINLIKSFGIKAGVVLNPHTNHNSIEYIINKLDLVLLMSVNPGFGGQSFINNTLQKARIIKELIKKHNKDCLLQIDGGVNNKNINQIKDSGVDIVVAGSYIFNAKSYQEAINTLR